MSEADDAEARVLDLRGLKCPMPALRTRRALLSLAAGHVIEVHCTDPLAVIDIPHLLRETGDVLVDTARQGRLIRFRIRRRSADRARETVRSDGSADGET